jgi:hypothetical protein
MAQLSQYVSEHYDYVIALCDKVAEACPIFPDDQAAAQGMEEQRYHALETVARQIMIRLRIWLELPAIASRVNAVPLA